MQYEVRSASAPVLVERLVELGELDEALDRAVAGRGGSIVVLGAAGAGKTALVRVLRERAGAIGVRVLSASAGQLQTRAPFGVVRRLLDAALADLSTDGREALLRGPGRRALRQLWGFDATAAPEPPPTQGDMLHSLGWLVRELASAGPLVLVVDDAQWSDEESLLFLGALCERVEDLPAVVAILARDDPADRSPALAALVVDRDAVVLRLAPLSHSGVQDLLRDRWPDVSADTAAAVTEVTGGNPFLVFALADALADQVVDPGPVLVRATVPTTVVDLMVARLAALPPREVALAQAVAVLDHAPLATAAALAGIEPMEAPTAADGLRRAGLLADTPELTFRHALLRAAVYAMAGPDIRDHLHRAAARLLAERPDSDRSRAAAHLLASAGVGDPWSVGLLRAAAFDARDVGAPQSAVALLRRAVDEPADRDVLPEVLLELGLAQARTFEPEAVESLVRAEALTTDPAVRVQCALAIASAQSYEGRHAAATRTLAQVRVGLADADRELRLTVDAAWAATALLVPDQVEAARRRLAGYDGLIGATVAERRLLVQQLTVATTTNRPAAEVRAYADAVIAGWDATDRLPETSDWVWTVVALAQIGDYDIVRRLTDDGLALAHAHGSVVGSMTASFARAFTELHGGDLVAAGHYYRQMLGDGPTGSGGAVGGKANLLVGTLAQGGLAQCLALQGRVEDALDMLVGFTDEQLAAAPLNGAAMIWFGRAVARNAAGDHLGALAAAREVGRLTSTLDIDSPTWAAWRALAIGPLRALGRIDEARTLAAEHLRLCEQGEVAHLVGEALCLAATVAPDRDEAVDLARAGVTLLATTGSRLRSGMGLLTLGSLLRRAGAKVEAREHLRAAAATLEVCGALPAAEFARTEFAATGARLTRMDQRLLTPSERRIALLAIDGLSNPAIAARLHVSRKTVETHLSAVYRKLDVVGRDGLTAEHLA